MIVFFCQSLLQSSVLESLQGDQNFICQVGAPGEKKSFWKIFYYLVRDGCGFLSGEAPLLPTFFSFALRFLHLSQTLCRHRRRDGNSISRRKDLQSKGYLRSGMLRKKEQGETTGSSEEETLSILKELPQYRPALAKRNCRLSKESLQ